MSKNGSTNVGNNNNNNNNTKKIKFSLNKSVQVTKVFAKENHRLTKNETIFTMVDTDHPDGKKEPFLSTVLGTVTKLYIHEWDTLSYGSIILEYEECLHTITFKNLCCDCGADLNQLKDRMEMISSRNSVADPLFDTSLSSSTSMMRTATTVSMEHAVPELRITPEMAEKYSIEERDRLLRERKLDLLVDLDQTLLHTTNSSNYFPYSPDVIAYQLSTQSSQRFYTKLRPGVKEFLANLLPYYQFHIVTFGERVYAHTMANLIDPNKTFFYHRILSRNECFDPTRKTANLGALFPCGDSMVCIIDDREDVWNYARNLVHVKPYVWFKDVGDINDVHLPSPPIPSEQLIPPISEKEFEEQLENSEHIVEERAEKNSNALKERTTEEGHQDLLQRGEKRKLDDDDDDNNNNTNERMDSDETSKKLKEQNDNNNEQTDTINIPVTTDPNITVDSDIYLRQLEIILKRIHTDFYASYDQWTQDKTRDMPDLKQILPDIRRQVLKNVSVCFSHLMPQGYPLEKHRATILARALGATVTQDLQISDNGHCLTTHVIAGKRTSKVESAIKYNIHVVTPEWLIDCYEQWERRAEENYILHSNYDVKKSRLFTKETPRMMYNDSNNGNDRISSMKQKTENPSNDEQVSSSTVSKFSKSSLKRARTPELPSTSDMPSNIIEEDEQTATTTAGAAAAETARQYNFSMSVDELSDMEKEVNDFCNDDEDEDDDDDDDSNDVQARPKKQQRTSSFSPITTAAATTTTATPTTTIDKQNDDEGYDYDSDSSSSQKLRDLILGKRREADSDDESFGDDEAPRGWKNTNQKTKKRQ
ncbi:unnamed protein product [Adineta steineri]|uniref:RNA polymerase II subunit A C-terminal domain phosphatase n=1 Tax=Adineta steineri TaxID=433720 RepID=A0A814UTV8_9BILA|nr:unnamed protein product [Adineta steineri]CAF1182002.1 unnamed protein product [Adineta steineri]CAF1193135.1 unnamed protein product [Adineta steineri]